MIHLSKIDNIQMQYEISNNDIGILIIALFFFVILFSPFFSMLYLRLYKKIKSIFIKSTSNEGKMSTIKEIQVAIEALTVVGKGATIVIDVRNETDEYINDYEAIDSLVTSNLLINIFWGSETPLHDGAVIISNNRLAKASAFITNLSKQKVPKKFGTRHRSALGLAEVTKSIIVVLSEETKSIRIFHNSKWIDVTQKELFEQILNIWV